MFTTRESAINEQVEDYLETRQYTKADILKNGKEDFSLSPIQLLVSTLLSHKTSQNNSLVYSSVTQNIDEIDNEFSKLMSRIVKLKDEKHKDEMIHTVFPIFCHLYLDMLQENNDANREAAAMFFVKHQPSFMTSGSYKEVLTNLLALETLDEIHTLPNIRDLRSQKYKLKLSSTALNWLVYHLVHNCEDPTIFLNIMQTWLLIEEIPETGPFEDDDIFESESAYNRYLLSSNDENLKNTLYNTVDEIGDDYDIDDIIFDTDDDDDDDNNDDDDDDDDNDDNDDDVDIDEDVVEEEQEEDSAVINMEDMEPNTMTDKSCDYVNDDSSQDKIIDHKLSSQLFENEEPAKDIFNKIYLMDKVPSIKSVLLYKLHDYRNNVTCGTFSLSTNLLVAGCMNSQIHLWNITGEDNDYNMIYENDLINASENVKYKPENYTKKGTKFHHDKSKIGVNNNKELKKNGNVNRKRKRKSSDSSVGNVDDEPNINTEELKLEEIENSKTFDADSKMEIDEDMETIIVDTNQPQILGSSKEQSKAEKPVPDFKIMRGHRGPITGIRILDDLHLVISTSHDTTMRVWDLTTYSCYAIYKGHSQPIWCLDVSALNMYIATGSRDRTARLWTLDKTFPVRIFAGHLEAVTFLSINMYIATGSRDRTARLWTLDKTFPVRIFAGHLEAVTCVKFHPNNLYLATGSSDNTVRLFNVSDGNATRLFLGHKCMIRCLSFTPDGEYLASAGVGSDVIIWDIALSQQCLNINLKYKNITCLDWASDSNVLAITLYKKYIFFYAVDKLGTGEETAKSVARYKTTATTFIYSKFSNKNTLGSIARVRH